MRLGYNCEHKGNVTKSECMECCETWQSPCKLRPPLMHKFMQFIERRPEDLISLTTLQGCPRAFFFRLTVGYYESYRAKTRAFWGSLWHEMSEDYKGDGDVIEQRFGYPISTGHGEFILTFQPDRIIPHLNLMVDYKTTGNVPRKGPWPNHNQQAGGYVEMVNSKKLLIEDPPYSGNFKSHPPFDIDWVQIFYIDWAQVSSRWEAGGIYVKPLEPIPYDLFLEPGKGQMGLQEGTLEVFQERLELFLDAKAGVLPKYEILKDFAERQNNWPLWMCSWGSGGCDFKDHCRQKVLQEERPKTDMFDDGIQSGRQGIFQQVKTVDGAKNFVGELDERSRGFLTEALKGEK